MHGSTKCVPPPPLSEPLSSNPIPDPSRTPTQHTLHGQPIAGTMCAPRPVITARIRSSPFRGAHKCHAARDLAPTRSIPYHSAPSGANPSHPLPFPPSWPRLRAWHHFPSFPLSVQDMSVSTAPTLRALASLKPAPPPSRGAANSTLGELTHSAPYSSSREPSPPPNGASSRTRCTRTWPMLVVSPPSPATLL